MIVVLASNAPPRLTDLDRLDRLHAELHDPLDAVRFDDLCEADDGEHVWLDVARARALGLDASDDPAFGPGFDGMIGYATSQGWLNDTGTHVRAHIEPAT